LVYLYDGAECMRPLESNPRAAQPRSYWCEELGSAMARADDDPLHLRPQARSEPEVIPPSRPTASPESVLAPRHHAGTTLAPRAAAYGARHGAGQRARLHPPAFTARSEWRPR
jgi:hypothetical protein